MSETKSLGKRSEPEESGQIDSLKQLAELPALEDLTLGNNPITKIDSLCLYVNKLKVLKIMSCPVVECPKTISYMSALTTLQLSNTEITNVPDTIGELINLTNLDLSCNQKLTCLPVSIGKLKKLAHLNISHCKELKELPLQLRDCTELLDIFSIENSIDIIPNALSRLPKIVEILVSVDAEGNKLNELKSKQITDEKVYLLLWLRKSEVKIPEDLLDGLIKHIDDSNNK